MMLDERRTSTEEERQMYRESLAAHKKYMEIHGEYMATQTDKIPVLVDGIQRANDGIAAINKILVGNGNIENSLCFRVATIETAITVINERVNGFFKTDDWRKDFLAGAVRSVATAVIAAAIIYFLKK
jgi:hypothetical protein